MFSDSAKQYISVSWGEPKIYYKILVRQSRPRFDIDMGAFDGLTELRNRYLLLAIRKC